MSKTKSVTNGSSGFTIIEVLIVLAIAGLILLIVFLAVPALQRNSRNTGRKNDVANILGAMSEFTNNNGGVFPASCAEGASGCNAANTWLANAKIGTIDKNLIEFVNGGPYASLPAKAGNGATGLNNTLDKVKLFNYLKCQDATTPTISNASNRSMVALYNVETGGTSVQLQCVESGS